MNIKSQQGFSLIEIMVALVIVAVSGAAGSKLLGVLFESSSDAQSRSIATSLAQRKMDDFRAFREIIPGAENTWEAALVADPPSMAYQYIVNNKGGLIESGEQTVIENSNTTYTLVWEVEDHWYFDVNVDGTATDEKIKPAGASDIPDYKMVTITVSWPDQKGTDPSPSISITSNISATTANGADKLAAAEEGLVSPPGPQVKYIKGVFPDIMPINVTDALDKATSLPLPEVSKKAGSTLVRFNSITYDRGTLIETRREDFLTVSCDCKVGTGSGKYPVGVAYWDDKEKALLHKQGAWQSGSITIGLSAALNNDPQPYCDTCCRDHYDSSTHPTTAGNEYVDACRMKRIDGLVSVIEDWKLIALNVIPNSYFFRQKFDGDTVSKEPDPVKIKAYSDYVNNLVRARMAAADAESTVINKAKAAFSTIDTSFIGSALTFDKSEEADDYTQLSARAVFLDLPPTAIYESGTDTNYTAYTVPLDRIPFYEENVTMLAGWVPHWVSGPSVESSLDDDYAANHNLGNYKETNPDKQEYYNKPTVNWVTNEALIDPPAYSRGLFFANVATTTTVKARLKNGNPGQVNIVNFDAGEELYLNLGSQDINNENGRILLNNILLPGNFTSEGEAFPKDSSISGGDAYSLITVQE